MRITLLFLCSFWMLSTLSAQNGVSFGFKAGLNFSNFTGGELESNAQASEENKFASGFHLGALANFRLTDIFGLRAELLFTQKGRETFYNGPSYFRFSDKDRQVLSNNGVRDVSIKISNTYFELPLLAYAKFGKFEVVGGGYVSVLIGSTGNGVLRYNASGLSEQIEFDLNYNYNKDEALGSAGNLQSTRVNGVRLELPSEIGAYYELTEKQDKKLHNAFDAGLIGGLSYYLNKGLFVNARVEYGLIDVTNEKLDNSFSKLDNQNQPTTRDDNDQNISLQVSVGFRF